MTVAESVAEWLQEKGISQAFGVIGAGNLALWEAIAKRGYTDICCVHHEQAAAMAASFYQRTCGRLALCLVTTGAGSTNAITGVMGAYMDSTPLLVISGNETAASMEGDTRVLGVQGYDSIGLANEFCKYAWRMHNASEVWILDEVHKTSHEPRQGPCWLDIPRDVQVENV